MSQEKVDGAKLLIGFGIMGGTVVAACFIVWAFFVYRERRAVRTEKEHT